MRWLALAVLLCCAVSCRTAHPPPLEEQPDFAAYFTEAGATGTFVLYDPAEERTWVHNTERAATRFIPASTFKIANSLIALEHGAVHDTTTVFPWDGQQRMVAAWNRDHTLATAFEHSTVWFYQELARRVGAEQMQQALDEAQYGNATLGGPIDMFWLTGGLRISALEQIDFLQRLHEGRLPFSAQTLDLVKGIMVEDRGADYVLRAKSGWADAPFDIGWYVGYVVHQGHPYYFALNIDMATVDQAPARRSIAQAILRDWGYL